MGMLSRDISGHSLGGCPVCPGGDMGHFGTLSRFVLCLMPENRSISGAICEHKASDVHREGEQTIRDSR